MAQPDRRRARPLRRAISPSRRTGPTAHGASPSGRTWTTSGSMRTCRWSARTPTRPWKTSHARSATPGPRWRAAVAMSPRPGPFIGSSAGRSCSPRPVIAASSGPRPSRGQKQAEPSPGRRSSMPTRPLTGSGPGCPGSRGSTGGTGARRATAAATPSYTPAGKPAESDHARMEHGHRPGSDHRPVRDAPPQEAAPHPAMEAQALRNASGRDGPAAPSRCSCRFERHARRAWRRRPAPDGHRARLGSLPRSPASAVGPLPRPGICLGTPAGPSSPGSSASGSAAASATCDTSASAPAAPRDRAVV